MSPTSPAARDLAFIRDVVQRTERRVYPHAFHWAGIAIFVATLAATALPDWNGLILGPAQGLGLLLPGLQAERRVRRLGTEP
jgi:hypothetical protein